MHAAEIAPVVRDELACMDATAQAALVCSKEVSPIELVERAIARIERLNPGLNAVVAKLYDEARRAARTNLPEGPFKGVPFLLKDSLTALGGTSASSASLLLRGRLAGHDSELVARLKRAGMVIVGRTNCAEFGLLPTTEPALYGPTRNPWDRNRSPGGSSGGSASAVAAGMVAMAHGSDGGGSIRIPASCCGLFGLKPTRARNPLGPDFGDLRGGLIAEHALTRSVRDSAALLDATSGPDIGDPYCAPGRLRPFMQEVGADPGRLRIAFSTHTTVPVHADCASALHEAVALCVSLGHELCEAKPAMDYHRAAQCFTTLWAAGCAATIEGIARSSGKAICADDVEPFTWALYVMGRRVSAADYQLAIMELQVFSRTIAEFFSRHDVWLTPVLTEPPPILGSFDAPLDDPFAPFRRAWSFAPIPAISNFTGQPAMSVPLYWNAQGLPIGSHFAGRFGGEATLFRLAAQLEQARGWAARRPALS